MTNLNAFKKGTQATPKIKEKHIEIICSRKII
jgi:hypothetical protein